MQKEIIGENEYTFGMNDSIAKLNDICKLRYHVYCNECKFLEKDNYPYGIEVDEFDPFSLHFVIEREGELIGTSRLILNSAFNFPFERYCKANLTYDVGSLDKTKVAEVSRLIISKSYRRRKKDGLYYSYDHADGADSSKQDEIDFRRSIRPIIFGLYREMYKESKKRGITHWFALMERSLWRLLNLHGFDFIEIGKEVDVYGPVKPYLAEIAKIERELKEKKPEIYEYFCVNT